MASETAFDLQKIPICVLHVPSRKDRRANMLAGLQRAGLMHAQFIPAVKGPQLISGATGYGAICEAAARRDEFVPVLVLEDDAVPSAHFKRTFNAPVNADAIYLGLSNCSPTFRGDGDYDFQVGACWENTQLPNLVRLLSMLSSHAILICSRRYAVFMAKALSYAAGKNIAWDIPIARRMSRFNVYALREPFFYQDGKVGGNEAATRITLSQIKRRPFVEEEPAGWELFGAYDTV